jgi:SAM-dependent methyltransferase
MPIYQLSRKISRWTKSLLPGLFPRLKQAYGWIRENLPGFDFYLDTPDRKILETEILPYLAAQPEIRKVLFVGCDWYTKAYRKIFAQQEYWTIEPDPSKKRYGSKHHVIDVLENLDRHFADDTFDLIVCNGVFGHGLNQPDKIEQALQQCFRCLRPNGMFVFGWNDLPENLPIPLDACQALRQFQPQVFAPLQTSQFDTQTPYRHFYNFYIKPIQVLH